MMMNSPEAAAAVLEEYDGIVQPPHSYILAATDRPGVRGPIRTSAGGAGPRLALDNGAQTLYEGLRRGGLARNPLGPCLGYRAISTSGFATPFVYTSYTEVVAQIDSVAAGLDALELIRYNSDDGTDTAAPAFQDDEKDVPVLAFYAKNCPELTMGEHAAYAVGAASVILYDTLGPQTVAYVLGQTQCRSVVATRLELPKLCQAKTAATTNNNNNNLHEFRNVILLDGVTKEAADMAAAANLEVHSFAKVAAVGAQLQSQPGGHHHRPPAPQDVAALCYTSGTTGDPKGARITHQNVIAAIAGLADVCPQLTPNPSDRHLSYLPLAHIFERVVQAQMLCHGASVGFFRGDPTLLVEDLQACRPTLLPVAPRVLNKIYDKIHAGIQAAGGLKLKLFEAALAAKTQGLREGRSTHALYDRLLFNKIKAALGLDCIRCMVSGSAPLSDAVMTFFRCLLGVPVVEGYGQTEGTAAATVGHPDDTTVGHVGGPVGSVEVCLYDVPEMGYHSTDRVHQDGIPCVGRGEICIRGPSIFPGYYQRPEETRGTIDAEGWLHSGDIGLWRPDGNLQIIDRKKNIFKLSQGEYVAPEKIENFLITCPLIGQVMVHGDSLQSCLVALVVPDLEPCQAWAQEHLSKPSLSLAELAASEPLQQAILRDIRRIAHTNQLHGFETPKAIALIPQPFDIETGLLTPTFKLKRPQIREFYRAEIDRLYAQLEQQQQSSSARSKL